MAQLRTPPTVYLAHVVPGLESVAAYELRKRVPAASPVRALMGFDERTSLLSFGSGGPADDLLGLRVPEDLFVLATEAEGLAWNFAGLRALREAIETSPRFEAAAMLALAQRKGRRPPRPTFRVVTRKAGEHTFRRADLEHAVERAVQAREPTWRLVEDHAHLEVWAHLVGETFVAGIRLTDITQRQRAYKRVSLPASLKPTIAAAMALVSQPRPDDTVLDPMCGAGTLLIERAESGRYRQLLGGDLDPEAVAAAQANVGRRYQPIELRQWDARTLPLPDGTVSAVISNLPFGRQIGAPAALRDLYPALLKEWARVLSPAGHMVLLTSETDLLRRSLPRGLSLTDRLPLLVRGYPAAIHLLRRGG
jgi:SAM-dependent methyltransferase